MPRTLDTFLDAFIQATTLTLRELCKAQIKSSRIITPNTQSFEPAVVAGVIGINSNTFEGTLCVHFPKRPFLQLMNGMLDERWEDLVPGIEDGATELTNIIFGNAKVTLNEAGYGIQMALPSLITGHRVETLFSGSSAGKVGIEFVLDQGTFWIFFELRSRKGDEISKPISFQEGTRTVEKNWSADVLLEFVKAVRKTLEVQFGTAIEVSHPFKKTKENQYTFDVGSVIGVNDQNFSGYFGMYFEAKTFLSLMEKLLGGTYTELDDEIQDGASEITNICFGVAKQILNEKGHQIQMALPYLIRGSQISSFSLEQDGRHTIAVPLTASGGRFWIEFGYKDRTD